jgi:hypothetical protein
VSSHSLTCGRSFKSYLVVTAILASSCFLLCQADFDLFARLAVGKLIAETGEVTTKDPFSFLLTKDLWVDHEWLAGLVFYTTHSFLGDWGLLGLNLLFCACTILVLSQAARGSFSRGPLSCIWGILCLIPCAYVWNSVIRSQVFTAFGVALCLLLFMRLNAQRKTLAFFLLYFFIWTNAHAGFVVGLGFLGIYTLTLFLRSSTRRPAIALCFFLVLCASTSLLTPYGLAYWDYLREALFMPRPDIVEWWPVQPFQPKHIFLWIVLFIFIFSLLSNHQQRLRQYFNQYPEFFPLLAISLFVGLRHERHIVFFYFVAFVYGGMLFEDFSKKISCMSVRLKNLSQALSRLFPTATFFIFLYSCVFLIARAIQTNSPLNYSRYPVQVFDYLEAHHVEGSLLVHFNEGSYALWRGYPRIRVSLDGRYEEVYPKETFDLVQTAYYGKSEEQTKAIRTINPDLILQCPLSSADFPAQSLLEYAPVRIQDASGCHLFQRKLAASE